MKKKAEWERGQGRYLAVAGPHNGPRQYGYRRYYEILPATGRYT